jgi:hypothetical protein
MGGVKNGTKNQRKNEITSERRIGEKINIKQGIQRTKRFFAPSEEVEQSDCGVREQDADGISTDET